ncbi:serpin family protein [Chloroflexota bacterium]
MKKIAAVVITMVMLVLSGCAGPVSAWDIESEKPREKAPGASLTDLEDLAAGNGEFTFDLYQALKGTEGNLFYSPYSISQALAMTYAGAKGETEKQMAETLKFLLPQNGLHRAFNTLDLELSDRGDGASGQDGEGFRLNIVNAIWGQKDYQFLTEYLDTLSENYGAGLRVLDFASEPEPSRITINDWVSEKTEDRIKDLIPQGMIDPATRLVLTNAIYFNAAWENQFEDYMTKEDTFMLLDGEEITVPMMRKTERFGYAEGKDYQAIELPYDGRELSMIVLLPDNGKFGDFQDSLDYERVKGIIPDITYQQVDLSLPKFEFESEFSLKQTLAEMGMPAAFSGGADFSGMTGSQGLFISEVVHKSFVLVDETGTEAAAATAVIMKESAAPMGIRVAVDRPFIFLIRDIQTEAILFAGRVMNPAN